MKNDKYLATVEEIATVKKMAVELERRVSAMPVSVSSESILSDTLTQARRLIAGLEKQRTDITKPILDSKKKVDAMFSPAVKALRSLEERVRDRIREMALARFEEKRLAISAVGAAMSRGEQAAIEVAMERIQSTEQEFSGFSARTKWEVESVDFSLLPDKFKVVCLNEAAVDEVIRELKSAGSVEPPVVPGIVFRLGADVRAKRLD